MRKHIVVIIGVGKLGARYLQGLLKISLNLDITCVDPSKKSLDYAQSLIEDEGLHLLEKIRFLTSYPTYLNYIDLVIVATSSNVRLKTIEKVVECSRVRYWILEKVLVQSLIDLNKLRKLLDNSASAWVNTSRRSMSWYKNIKKTFNFQKPLKFVFQGNGWGIACNSIHFIDLVSWWTGETIVNIDTRCLDTVWYESKRLGYYDVIGKLAAKFSGNSSLELIDKDDVKNPPILFINSYDKKGEVHEQNGYAKNFDGTKILGNIEFQNTFTHSLVENILKFGNCDLPTFLESFHQHKIFIPAMLDHWNRQQKRAVTSVPIT